MARVPFTPPPGFDELSIDEKLEYMRSLWGRIVSKSSDVPVPGWHRQVIADRIAAYRAGKGASRPWSEFREELRSLLGAPEK
jgi:putative addiction module component (TIGR02574 family)